MDILLRYRMSHQLLCRLARYVRLAFDIVKTFPVCHICIIVSLLSEVNCVMLCYIMLPYIRNGDRKCV